MITVCTTRGTRRGRNLHGRKKKRGRTSAAEVSEAKEKRATLPDDARAATLGGDRRDRRLLLPSPFKGPLDQE